MLKKYLTIIIFGSILIFATNVLASRGRARLDYDSGTTDLGIFSWIGFIIVVLVIIFYLPLSIMFLNIKEKVNI